MYSKGTTRRTCRQCGSEFLTTPGRVRKGKALCCSKPCAGTYRRLLNRAAAIVNDDGSMSLPIHWRDGHIRAYAIVDGADGEWAGQWTWSMSSAGYAFRKDGKTTVFLHREILGLVRGDSLEGDHINRDRLDNRRSNLRIVTKAQNLQNTSGGTAKTSAYRGVSWNTAMGCWVAAVTASRKMHHLGFFADEAEAAEVARAARSQLLPFAVD